MASSNMCVLVVCLLVAVVESRVVKPKEFPLPPEGVTVEITVKNNLDKAHPVVKLSIDVNELLKKVIIEDSSDLTLKEHKELFKGVPRVGSRHGILGGSCPIGYVMRGGFCFPDDEY